MGAHKDYLILAEEAGMEPHEYMQRYALPKDMQRQAEQLGVDMVLRELVKAVADQRSITAEVDNPKYLGVRPASHGAIAGYVNQRFVDLCVDREKALQLQTVQGWLVVKSNASTGIVRVPSDLLTDRRTFDRVVEVFVAALDRRSLGPDFRQGGGRRPQGDEEVPQCPICNIQMVGGACDVHD